MSRYSAASDAAIWDESRLEIDQPCARPDSAGETAAPSVDVGAIIAALNKIQLMAETLSETNLDLMQVEVLGCLIDAGMDLRRVLLGEASSQRAFEEDDEFVYLDDDFELASVDLAVQDYLDYSDDDDVYVEAKPPPFHVPSMPDRLFADADDVIDVLDAEDFGGGDVEAPPFDRASGAGPLAGLRVMLVDESAAHLAATAAILRDLGAEGAPVAADSASDALRRGAFDAALVDMQSASRNGLSLIRAMRASSDVATNRVAIFAIVQNASPEQIRECLSAGADGCLNKPASRDQVLEQLEVLAIEKSFERPRARA